MKSYYLPHEELEFVRRQSTYRVSKVAFFLIQGMLVLVYTTGSSLQRSYRHLFHVAIAVVFEFVRVQ